MSFVEARGKGNEADDPPQRDAGHLEGRLRGLVSEQGPQPGLYGEGSEDVVHVVDAS